MRKKYTMSEKRIKRDIEQMRKSGTMSRNKEILKKSEHETMRELADYYGISFQRIQQIVKRMKNQRDKLE